MGRSPDYKAAFLNTLGANAEFYGKFADNARAWHKRGAGGRALSQPRAGQSADRPQQAGRAGEGRLHHHPEGDRRRHLRLRRQGGGHQLGAHPLQLPRPEHGPGDQRPEHGGDVHRAHEHARHQADLPRLLRAGRRRHRLALGLSAHLAASTRTTPSSCSTTPSSPGRTCSSIATSSGCKQFYPRSGFVNGFTLAGLHAARREARFHRRAALQGRARDRRRGLPRRAGADRRGDRLAQPVLVAHRRHGLQSRALGRRRGAAQHPGVDAPTACS